MSPFGIIEATSFGYTLVWREWRYLLYLAAVPMLIKLVCHMAVVMLGWHDQYMRQGLVMLPSYFADGWMLSHFVRLIFLEQRWPYQGSGDRDSDRRKMEDRARGVMGGMLAFVVVEFLLAGFVDALYQISMVAVETSATPSLAVSMFVAVCSIGLLWLFRYFWFYIPAAVNYPLPYYSRALNGYMTSVYLLAVWFASVIPGIALYKILVSVFINEPPRDGSYGLGVEFAGGVLGVGVDTILSFLVTGAIAYGIRAMVAAYQKNH